MKTTHILLTSGLSMCSDKIIKNINIPACKNCIYYKPRMFDREFTSTFTICEKFGNKNIITDEITYDYADLCRKYDDKCGEKGKYFKQEPYIGLKIFKHTVVSNIPVVLFIVTPIVLSLLAIIGKSINDWT